MADQVAKRRVTRMEPFALAGGRAAVQAVTGEPVFAAGASAMPRQERAGPWVPAEDRDRAMAHAGGRIWWRTAARRVWLGSAQPVADALPDPLRAVHALALRPGRD